ncbi:sulfite exporter TauE/SafE family protein [Helicobacter suis]|uniref:sulfite exporter TauE/SafE family protein n=1 Tax=Helicobacter suis TaxID=104628 RepID=UPI0013D2E3D7|nr:sulfite exporter TauE/SafE family protein [Helicobacter suis]
MEFLYLFLNASLMSLGHCVGMCGGIVLAYCQAKFTQNTPLKSQILGHGLYSLGRISTYICVGLLAFLGFRGFLELASRIWHLNRMHLQAIVFIIMGGLLIGLALGYVFKLKITKGLILTRHFKNLLTTPQLSSFYILGLLNGLLPCSMVYYFVLNALTQPNIERAFFVLLLLGLATFAPMFIFGLVFGKFLSSKLRALFLKIAFLMMLGFGGYNIYMGVQMLTTTHMGHR